MGAEHPVAKPPRSSWLTPAFTTVNEIKVGDIVFDRDYEMPGAVRTVDAPFIEIIRPTNLLWRVHYRRIRPASPWERQQLAAIGRLHRTRLKGLPAT
jgi:hypothetical protein